MLSPAFRIAILVISVLVCLLFLVATSGHNEERELKLENLVATLSPVLNNNNNNNNKNHHTSTKLSGNSNEANAQTKKEDRVKVTFDDARRNKYNAMPLTIENVMHKVKVWDDAPVTVEDGSPAIVCITHTYTPNHRHAAKMHEAWGRQCTRHYIFTNGTDPTIPMGSNGFVVDMGDLPGGYGYNNIWNKVRHIFLSLHKKGEMEPGRTDFFFIAGDDVLLIVENLKKYLLSEEVWPMHKKSTPLLLGHRMTVPEGQHFLSGAGYLLNDAAARLFIEHNQDQECNPNLTTFAEDVMMSRCLSAFGCPPRDSFDPFGEDRIVIVSPYHIVQQTKDPNYMWWYAKWHRMREKPMPTGNDCISVDAFLFHYMRDAELDTTMKVIRRRPSN